MATTTKKKPRKTMATKNTSKKKSSYLKRFSKFSRIKKALSFAAAFALVATAVLIVTHANANPYDDVRQAKLVNNPHTGMIYNGLKAIKADANHPCKGEFEVGDFKINGQPLCTHGPDEAPAGVDVANTNVQAQINLLKSQPTTQTTVDQLRAASSPTQFAAAYSGFANHIPYPESPIQCTSGPYRIQLVLLTHVADNADVRSLMQHTAHRVESELEYSALHSGPGAVNKHFRFVTNSSCQPTVSVALTEDAFQGYNDYYKVVTYLSHRGYDDPKTKYLVWDYAGSVQFCGYGTLYNDTNPSVTGNTANKVSGWALVGPSCWSSEEMHEILHNLGAVQATAPHTSGAYHCLDEYDIMCYPDHVDSSGAFTNCIGSNGVQYACGQNGYPVYIAPNCTDPSFNYQLDCNKNDYFNAGTVSATNYLYNHWNVAHSPYMQ
jgi:hypothetical protein